jgi:hypothetical protein
MGLFSSLRRVIFGAPGSRTRPACRKARLRLERLESRETPSAVLNNSYGVFASQADPGAIGVENTGVAHSGEAGAINYNFGQAHGIELFV